jgi:hypothetical protein
MAMPTKRKRFSWQADCRGPPIRSNRTISKASPRRRQNEETITRIPLACAELILVDITGCHLDQEHACDQALPGSGTGRCALHTRPYPRLHLPNHPKDGFLTGDALFLDEGGAGRDDLAGGDAAAHWESLQRILLLSENLIVCPAHDYRRREPSSLAEQKRRNPHMKPRTKEEFVRYVEDLKLGPADWMKDVLKANYTCLRDAVRSDFKSSGAMILTGWLTSTASVPLSSQAGESTGIHAA